MFRKGSLVMMLRIMKWYHDNFSTLILIQCMNLLYFYVLLVEQSKSYAIMLNAHGRMTVNGPLSFAPKRNSTLKSWEINYSLKSFIAQEFTPPHKQKCSWIIRFSMPLITPSQKRRSVRWLSLGPRRKVLHGRQLTLRDVWSILLNCVRKYIYHSSGFIIFC